jgi:hypothetical protein
LLRPFKRKSKSKSKWLMFESCRGNRFLFNTNIKERIQQIEASTSLKTKLPSARTETTKKMHSHCHWKTCILGTHWEFANLNLGRWSSFWQLQTMNSVAFSNKYNGQTLKIIFPK